MTVSRYYKFLNDMAERFGIHTENVEKKMCFEYSFDNEGQVVIYTGLKDENEVEGKDSLSPKSCPDCGKLHYDEYSDYCGGEYFGF